MFDPNGKQAFFKDLYTNTKRGIEYTKKACKYVAKQVRHGVERKLDATINGDNNFATSLALTTEFVLGVGPESRTFGPDHPFTQELKESHLTTVALDAFYKGYQDYQAGNLNSIPDHYRVDFGILGETTHFRTLFHFSICYLWKRIFPPKSRHLKLWHQTLMQRLKQSSHEKMLLFCS